MERLCYLSKNYPSTDGSGNKAKTDNEDTLALMGAVNIANKRTGHRSKIAAFFVDLAGIARYVCSVRKGDRIVLQYPHKKYFSFVCRVARWRGAKTITLIHDLGSFRRKRLTVEKEIGRLMNTDYVIASNEVMRQWLIDHGFSKPTGSLGLFDYRSKSESKDKTEHKVEAATEGKGDLRIVYAGALSMRKNAFMLDMAKATLPYQLHVFGNRNGLPEMQDNPQVIFHGFLPADEFISTVDADFGLVWDARQHRELHRKLRRVPQIQLPAQGVVLSACRTARHHLATGCSGTNHRARGRWLLHRLDRRVAAVAAQSGAGADRDNASQRTQSQRPSEERSVPEGCRREGFERT